MRPNGVILLDKNWGIGGEYLREVVGDEIPSLFLSNRSGFGEGLERGERTAAAAILCLFLLLSGRVG